MGTATGCTAGLRGVVVSAALVLAAAARAEPPPLLCLGTDPRFMLSVTGAVVRFDYLGDGTFRLDPPLTVAHLVWQRHRLVTKRAVLPVVLEERACRIGGLDFPMRVEIGVPTLGDITKFLGCCLWQDGDGPP